MVNHNLFAVTAYGYRVRGIPYTELDCQAFVERVLYDLGVKRNWRGSNHMWREALSWKGTVEEAKEKFGEIPSGAWLFTVVHDGGEVERGYHDNEGNAKHVGIYTGLGLGAMHSSTGGVQETAFPATRWTHIGLARDVDYGNAEPEDKKKILLEMIEQLRKKVDSWEF